MTIDPPPNHLLVITTDAELRSAVNTMRSYQAAIRRYSLSHFKSGTWVSVDYSSYCGHGMVVSRSECGTGLKVLIGNGNMRFYPIVCCDVVPLAEVPAGVRRAAIYLKSSMRSIVPLKQLPLP